jgi:major membrane immunogen (membrane-anchored lipoprotein)
MKKIIFFFVLMLLLCGCGAETEEAPDTVGPYASFEFTHYASGGTAETYTAVILFEQSNSTFTAYQVAFNSCTCRDSLANYLSVCYVELLNTKNTADEAAIRSVTFGENRGLWGDSNPNYYVPEYTETYYNEHFVQSLVRLTKADFDAWGGYGSELTGVDAVTGATVSAGNITSMLKSLFAYHAEKYYGDLTKSFSLP